MNKTTNKVVFFNLPPSMVTTPSPTFSILSAFLHKNKIEANTKYLNVALNHHMDRPYEVREMAKLLPFLYLLNQKHGDQNKSKKIRYLIYNENPTKFYSDISLKETFFKEFITAIHNTIESAIEGLDYENITLFGLTSKFWQWIPGEYVASCLKEKYPNIPIVLGGMGTKNAAKEILKVTDNFDYTVYGEGEYPLLELIKSLNGESDITEVPRLIYKENGAIKESGVRNSEFTCLDEEPLPYFNDYIEQFHKHDIKNLYLPIEISRGCHWGKCKFCYLNSGYTYRYYSNDKIIENIKACMKKYDFDSFIVIANDMVGKDIKMFDELLDKLIELQLELPHPFRLKVAEVITGNFTSGIIKKMSLAGFESIQIGYEANTDKLLDKINKKQSFADNTLFIKFANKYGINVKGANVLAGIVDEEDSDVFESIDNLHFLRFYLSQKTFELNRIHLQISHNSRYYAMLDQKERDLWNVDLLYSLTPDNLKEKMDRFKVYDFEHQHINRLWGSFDILLTHYYNKLYSYTLHQYNNIIVYREFLNERETKSLYLDQPYYWDVLKIANDQVVSLDQVYNQLNNRHANITLAEIEQIVEELKAEYLLYANEDKSNIVSIIDTSNL
ncbi:MAG: B12-binding domain-containing radical SAM protein [archaeon]